MPTEDKIRIDKYLWAIRLFKTRSLASEACLKGKVRLNDQPVKASKTIHIGEQYDIRTPTRKWKIQVTALLEKRVSYQEAILHYLDLTPPDEQVSNRAEASVFHTGKRLSKQGRMTKQEKRDWDALWSEKDDE